MKNELAPSSYSAFFLYMHNLQMYNVRLDETPTAFIIDLQMIIATSASTSM